MLKPIRLQPLRVSRPPFAIVAATYNRRYVDGMLRAARTVFGSAGVKELTVVRVPGAFEVPVVPARLARHVEPRLGAVVCLGAILRGETSHAEHIGVAVSHALMRVQIDTEIPIIHAVLLFENEQQARVRCLEHEHNRGREAAGTALRMAEVMARIDRAIATRNHPHSLPVSSIPTTLA